MKHVDNEDRAFGGADHYWGLVIRLGADEVPLLFTDAQLKDAAKRARKNPEDVARIGDAPILVGASDESHLASLRGTLRRGPDEDDADGDAG